MPIKENILKKLFEIDKDDLFISEEFVEEFLNENSELNNVSGINDILLKFFSGFKINRWTKTGIELTIDFLNDNIEIKEISDKEIEFKRTIENSLLDVKNET